MAGIYADMGRAEAWTGAWIWQSGSQQHALAGNFLPSSRGRDALAGGEPAISPLACARSQERAASGQRGPPRATVRALRQTALPQAEEGSPSAARVCTRSLAPAVPLPALAPGGAAHPSAPGPSRHSGAIPSHATPTRSDAPAPPFGPTAREALAFLLLQQISLWPEPPHRAQGQVRPRESTLEGPLAGHGTRADLALLLCAPGSGFRCRAALLGLPVAATPLRGQPAKPGDLATTAAATTSGAQRMHIMEMAVRPVSARARFPVATSSRSKSPGPAFCERTLREICRTRSRTAPANHTPSEVPRPPSLIDISRPTARALPRPSIFDTAARPSMPAQLASSGEYIRPRV